MLHPIKVKISCLKHCKSIPKYATRFSAGADIFASIAEPIVLKKGQIGTIPSGIELEIPEGYEIQIRPRSGLAMKHGITLANAIGTIDSDFRDEIKVILINLGNCDYTVNPGDRIAQMVLTPVYQIEWDLAEINPSDTRFDGFGSTGR